MSVTNRTFATIPGASFIVPTGIFRSNVLVVARNGEVYEEKNIFTIEPGKMQWYWFLNRIRFNTDAVFAPGEKVYVMYKV